MKSIGLIITSYNRPDYLRQCLQSVKAADLSQVATVLVVDDCSTDKKTNQLINDFELDGVELVKVFSKENRSIKGSLLFGLDILFSTCNVVTNLDGDAIVRPDFISRLLSLKERFSESIITGFNCTTKNRNGTERHIIIESGDGFNTKKSVGGINMLFDKGQYLSFVRPALVECLERGGNWDHKACINSYANGYPVVCCVPSVVQHIGVDSSMGHSAGGEPPDIADDFNSYDGSMVMLSKIDEVGQWAEENILRLPNVTLVSVDDNIDAIIKTADISCRHIEFGAVKLLSSKDSSDKRAVKIRHLGSKQEYSIFLMKEIIDYIDTPYFITIQADGYIIDHTKWNNEWLKYDYIGAPWFWHKDHMKVGNGAMSLRSRRLHKILKEDEKIIPTNDRWIKERQEDHNICRIYREYLEKKYEIWFAPVEVAERFSIEAWGHPTKRYSGQFGFHGKNIDFSKSNLEYKPY